MPSQAEIGRIQMQWLAEIGQSHTPCLHVGCGEKYLSWAINIDPNPSRKHVDFRDDVHDLPMQSESFASVISCHVIPALRDPVRAFDEMIRVLKPGGIMAHVIPDNSIAPMRHDRRFPWDFQHHNWMSPEHFRDQVLSHFKSIEVLECRHFEQFDFSFRVLAIKKNGT